jgi:3-phosphoshikimate 1-carboxyvinyltransferase
MQNLLTSTAPVLDAEDAGTTMRFLTAFCALTGRPVTLTGTERMKQRPIEILVNALRTIGATVAYTEKDGYPPVVVGPFTEQRTDSIQIQGVVSSQYISALMMIAPTLKHGLTLNFIGKITSRPYIEMTASLMRTFGVVVNLSDQSVQIPNGMYKPTDITVEADWSSASYWFAFTALAESAEVLLPQLTIRSIQGDAVIVDIMEQLGVKAEPRGSGLLLRPKDHHKEFEWDFTNCPDLAQTVAVVCTAKNIRAKFTGLESLRIKETDRIKALQTELGKIGGDLVEEGSSWLLSTHKPLPISAFINTHLDHRMAMAFAPLAAKINVAIDDPLVTRKSYPTFWDDVRSLGFEISEHVAD